MNKKEITRRKIINAAIKEFGESGFDAASTNVICKEAQVSKGTIFFYFENKATLYYEAFLDLLLRYVHAIEQKKFQHEDPIQVMVDVSFWKMEYYLNHPNESKLMMEALSNPPNEVRSRIYSHIGELTKLSMDWLFANVDWSRFDKKYSQEEIKRYLQYSLAGIQASVLKQGINIEELLNQKDDVMKYLEALLKGMEKEHGESI